MELETPTASSTAASSSCVSREEFNKSGKQGEIYVLYIYTYIYTYLYIERERDPKTANGCSWSKLCIYPWSACTSSSEKWCPETSKDFKVHRSRAAGNSAAWDVMTCDGKIFVKILNTCQEDPWGFRSDMIWHDYHDLIRYFYVATSSPTSRLIRNVARDQSRRIATYVMEEQHQGSQKFTRHTDVYSASCFITATYGIIATE